jgi:hypothetical protein
VRGALGGASETGQTRVLTASDVHVTDYPTAEAIRVEFARFGITRINFASLNNPFPATQVMSLPYVFGSTKARASCCGWSCRETSARGIREARLIGLAIYDSGARCWWRAGRCARQVLNNSPSRTEPVALLLMSVADLRRGLQRCRATTGLIAFYLAVLAVLLVVAFVPTLSLWLPSLLRAAAWRPTLPAVPPA